jgi:hypothetical protein
MANFNMRVWNNERVYMVDFERATVPDSVPAAQRQHPHRMCPDIDQVSYMDDAQPAEHGPIVSARVGQGNVRVRVVRTEISTDARLYAVSANTGVVTVAWPNGGLLTSDRKQTLILTPVAAGRTTIDIHYFWPDGPVIARLNVVVRATLTVNIRVHLVTANGVAPHPGAGASFLGRTAKPGENVAQHTTNRIAEVILGVNQVMEPRGILINVVDTVNTAWAAALYGGAGTATQQTMRAMALSPNRSATRVNLYLADVTGLPAGVSFVALGPPIAWAVAVGARFPNSAGNPVGSGIVVDTTATPFTGSILAHEFGHVFSLGRIAPAGTAIQWHTVGDQPGPGGPNTGGWASRDDVITRRRLMYPFTTLANSPNKWRNDVGYGVNMGALLTERRLTQDVTFEEGGRAFTFASTNANIYSV